MANTFRSRLLALNDERLHPFLTSTDEATRREELDRLFRTTVEPLVRDKVAEYVQTEWPIQPDDANEIVAQVRLKLLRKLLAARLFEEESVQSVDGYLVTLTHNALHDLMRRRSPERSRLKSRIRYVFQHDPRLAIWKENATTVVGLAEWRQEPPRQLPVEGINWPAAALDSSDPAKALVAFMKHAGHPVSLQQVVTTFFRLWQVGDESLPETPQLLVPASQGVRVEARQYLSVLWEEILLLPARQRAALLLNLREPGGGNGVLLFVIVGIASIDRIADAAGFSRKEWVDIWEQLPLDDLTIGKQLDLTRQQVINLRKSARERLARRMAMRSMGSRQRSD